MSTFKMLLVALLLAGFGAFAQDSAQTPPAANAEPLATTAPKHMHGDQAEHRLKRLSKNLNLTDDQKEKIRPILEDEQQQMKAVEGDSTLTAQQKHKKTREIRMSSKSQMSAILTPEQKEKIQDGRMHGEGHHRMNHGNAAPGSTSSSPTDQQQ
jgi:periplasmic protein CpxP/Spy